MRAFVIESAGTEPTLGEFPEPDDGLPVLAAGLNPVDLIMAGPMFDDYMPFPRVLGMEAVVQSPNGPAYTDATIAPHGSFADAAAVDRNGLWTLPDGLEPASAIALGIAGLAGWLSLTEAAHLQPGETVAIIGATGATGQIAVQAARLLGASCVVAVGRSRERVDRVSRSDSAIRPVVLDDSLDDSLDGQEFDDVDVVVDVVGGEPTAAVLAACPSTARVVSVGGAAPDDAIRYNSYEIHPAVRRSAFMTLAAHHLAGDLTLAIDRTPLADIENQWKRQAASPGLKIVVEP